jgi:hypothetical protein
METTTVPVEPQITGNVLLYSAPEPLSPEAHGNLGLKRSETPYGFATFANSIPLQVTEFGPASLSYPIIFAGNEYQPLAIMGLRPNENLFVTPDGGYEFDAYIPAYIRRYPFVLAKNEGDQQMIVCIDRSATALTEGGDVPLFENGKPTQFTEAAIQFCSDFEAERLRTENFVQLLKSLDLFELKEAHFTPRDPNGATGEPIKIADYFAVSEEKLNKLPTDKFVELRDTGALQQIYAHINSLFGWDRLVSRTLTRTPPVANA